MLIVVNNYSEIMTLTEKLLKYRQGWGYVYDYLENPSVEDFEKKAEDADVVVITDKAGNREYILDYCVKTQKEILMVPDMFGIILYSAEPQFVDDLLMFAMRPPGLKPYQVLTKRGFDICISLTVLIILSPVMLLVACLINVTSSGGIIFKQERLGLGGKPFKVFKFRTMVANAEEATGPVLATENDPRVTRLGSFLRASRLDELPQLFNVLSGDMSIVGPRPEREFFVTQFSEFVPFYRYRMVVRPGVTGLAQVMGRYTTSAEDKLRFDLMYIRNYSLLLDFNILIQTIRVVLEWEKAAGVNQRTEGKVFEKADRHLGA
jgi:exopolysaccharide biosynthesis polyprenyl glycosylphosphotransferase